VRFSVRVDDTLYPDPTPANGWTKDYLPWVVSPVRPLVYDLRHSSDSSADAARFFAAQVQSYLRSFEKSRVDLLITTVYSGRLQAPSPRRQIARFNGNSTGAALAWMLLVSDNDVAERFFRNSSIAAGLTGSWADARMNEMTVLSQLGVDTAGWNINDGSGVSRADRLTARGLVTLLRASISPTHPELAPLKGFLPVGGVSGTLKAAYGRYSTAPTKCARGKVSAKTGTLHDTVGLAGFANGAAGRLKVFAVMVNNWNTRYSVLNVRQAVDQIPATATGCF
jgi:D-alanyl-D-alanine carboxypeptidase/D-alanyl-D-alanine-endopeptidase (penicillin-binding protein 4)